jgi:N-acetylneuraminic acid mutarotase
VNGRICVAGGRDGGDINFFSKVILPTDCFDLTTEKWSQEANIPNGRGGSSYGTTCDGKLMVAGGEGGSKTSSKVAWSNVDVFDGSSWTSIDSLNVGRHGSGLAVDCLCNQIYIASGARTLGGSTEITSVETLFANGVDVPCSS